MQDGVPGEEGDDPPSARNGPNGIAILRAALPCRASSTTDGHERGDHPDHQRDRNGPAERAPSSSASLTSPMPMPAG